MTKSQETAEFGYIYWRNLYWKTSVLVQWNISKSKLYEDDRHSKRQAPSSRQLDYKRFQHRFFSCEFYEYFEENASGRLHLQKGISKLYYQLYNSFTGRTVNVPFTYLHYGWENATEMTFKIQKLTQHMYFHLRKK